MVALSSFLSSQNLTLLLLQLRKLQADLDPQIRTNAIVRFAKISDYIDPANRTIMLVNFFSKSTSDSFPQARKSATAAFRTCSIHFPNTTIATSVIPSISPLCVDPDQNVKSLALKTIQFFLDCLNGIINSTSSTPSKNENENKNSESPNQHEIEEISSHVQSTTEDNPASQLNEKSSKQTIASNSSKLRTSIKKIFHQEE